MSDKNVNKVVFGDETIMDISDSTVTEGSLLKGTTAYSADGSKIVGTMEGGADLDLSVVDGKLNQTYGDEEGTETTSPIALNSSLESANQKLDAIANAIQTVSGGGSYTLPVASADTLGGIKVGDNLSINESGVLSGKASNTIKYVSGYYNLSTAIRIPSSSGLKIQSTIINEADIYNSFVKSFGSNSRNIIPYSLTLYNSDATGGNINAIPYIVVIYDGTTKIDFRYLYSSTDAITVSTISFQAWVIS